MGNSLAPGKVRRLLAGRAPGRFPPLVALALMSALLVTSLAGCGPSQAKFDGSLQFFGWTAAVDLIEQRVAAFQQATGLQVAYSNTAWAQYHDAAVAKFAGGGAGDLVYASDMWIPEWVEAGWIMPVDGMPGLDDYRKEMMPAAIQAATYKGKFYGLPYYGDYMAFMYHAEMLERAGVKTPPTTWSEVTAAARKVKEAGLAEYPLLIPLAQETWLTEHLYTLVYSRGSRFFTAENEPAFDQPGSAAAAALQWLVDAIHTHKIMSPAVVETGELAALKAIQSGQVAITLMPRFRLSSMNDPKQSQVAGKFRMALMPSAMNGRNETVAWVRPFAISSRAAQDKERLAAAWQLMQWMGGKDNTGTYGTAKGLLFANGSSFVVLPLFQDPEVKAFYRTWGDPRLMQEQSELARSKDGLTPYFPEWNTFMNATWGKAVLKQISVGDALKQSATKWRDLKQKWQS